MQKWAWIYKHGIEYITVPDWVEKGVIIAFSSRKGGFSITPYNSLNMGLHVGDDYEMVIRNREKFFEILGVSLTQMVGCQQVHGNQVVAVTEDQAGYGAFQYDSSIPETDAMICSVPGLVITTFYADCLPVFFFDPVKRAVGLAHSGWKGTFSQIGSKVVQELAARYGSRPREVKVFIGPGIQKCCYRIDPGLAGEVIKKFPGADNIISMNKNGHFWDLSKTIYNDLLESGVLRDNIMGCSLCTSCNPERFFSYRRESGATGRMAAIIGLKY
ncbi:MAG: peptidoglycan editing factor PgeF [Syntrophomonadaceae bacterium]